MEVYNILSRMSIPVSLSTSYLFLHPFGISITDMKSSGFILSGEMSCQMFIDSSPPRSRLIFVTKIILYARAKRHRFEEFSLILLPSVLFCANIIKQITPKWWNWQTRRTQNPVMATSCGFKSRLRHHGNACFAAADKKEKQLGFSFFFVRFSFARFCHDAEGEMPTE